MPAIEKKRRVESDEVTVRDRLVGTPSKIFTPFRTIGHVANSTPISVSSFGRNFLVACSVGRAVQIYDVSTLHLMFVTSPQTPAPIQSLHFHRPYVYATWDNCIGVYFRGKLLYKLECDTKDKLVCVRSFGENLVAINSSQIFVFKRGQKKEEQSDDEDEEEDRDELDPPFEYYTTVTLANSVGAAHSIIHPPTYLNKIVVATRRSLLLVNIRTGKVVFSTNEIGSDDEITAIVDAPVVNYIGVGTASGKVHVYNLKLGERLMAFHTGSRVNCLSFRSDSFAHLGVGTASGDAFFFDLNSQKRLHVLRETHEESEGGITSLVFLPGMPAFLTCGGDNSLREWVFDPVMSESNKTVIAPPRALRHRAGHSAPPTSIKFVDEEAHFLVSASGDASMWRFSLRKDAQNQEFSQVSKLTEEQKNNPFASKTRAAGPSKKMRVKLPPVTSLAQTSLRQQEWDSILTTHKGENWAQTWDGHRGRVGAHRLPTSDGGIAQTVTVTQCGNFGVVGSATGSVDIFNLQSGILRRKLQGTPKKKAITGIVVDSLNREVITTSLDRKVRFNDFHTGKLLETVTLAAPITKLVLHDSSDLIACALDDFSVVVIDTITKRVVRVLEGRHANQITDICFSPDAKWVISASLDSTICTWDLLTGACIDVIRLDTVATNVEMSRNGDWLATAHVTGNGVCLWSNRGQFVDISSAPAPEIESSEVAQIDAVGSLAQSSVVDGAFEETETEDQSLAASIAQIEESLLTLSLAPSSKMNTLVHLDTIKMRNKPKEAPKAPEQAPFFLQLTGADKKPEEATSCPDGLVPSNFDAIGESAFSRLLREAAQSGEYHEFIDHLAGMSPAQTDLEIRSLNSWAPYTELIAFVDAMAAVLEKRTNYELGQAWMNMFLRCHGDVIMSALNPKIVEDEEEDEVQQQPCEPLKGSLTRWKELNQHESNRMEDIVKYCQGVINYLRVGY
ncbi:Utp21 specific WD40 associated putative domain-domain-containing protein [Yarrowia lipolytica]|uniref:YALI0B13442p n=2 Tax=Yarrowia lipolytica TaxID=4952 RepID=Q6CES2_YARLI|nr:YALI0B13442p [Yarrowia lipolytica CLIB122]AOW01647.1 hypothetical protein YALI1_B17908g [Yarrowia lipolytica]KAB8284892.1 Utp21 specific WD40 associated putative domain-containing protein [Yarrowia lipolytica]KAE8175182.1 Utp21 specific WD40 associated putative domain-containing protein [Yarrowia lipolytica]KAJ8052451.1 Utp21 specific WD40 associated putative domain-containing protein [Yarrowia lipolytica]QNP97166.1 WD repeat-containing protein 36 [Yarrowia lipolytica]|eukprot:XP_500840.1 YALI0B13442p [Yarrowia lipolytica CLIB122]